MNLRHRRNARALPRLFVAILFMSCGSESDPSETPGAADPLVAAAVDSGVNQGARDAIVLLLDAEDRCVRVANSELSIMKAGGSRTSWHELATFRRDTLKPELTIAERTLIVVDRLRADFELTNPPEVLEPVEAMSKAVKELCLVAESSGYDTLDRTVSRQHGVFRSAERRLSRVLQITDGERREILGRYRTEVRSGDDLDPSSFVGLTLERRNTMLSPDWELQVDPRDHAAFAKWYFANETNFAAFKAALAGFMPIKDENAWSEARLRRCSELSRVCSYLLRQRTPFLTPEPSVGQALRRVFYEFREAGESCQRDDYPGQLAHTQYGLAALDEVTEMLRLYDLEL